MPEKRISEREYDKVIKWMKASGATPIDEKAFLTDPLHPFGSFLVNSEVLIIDRRNAKEITYGCFDSVIESDDTLICSYKHAKELRQRGLRFPVVKQGAQTP